MAGSVGSNVSWIDVMRVQQSTGPFALCVEDGGMEDLEVRKVYQVLPDRELVAKATFESLTNQGEDYIYPSDMFVPVKLPAAVVRRPRARAGTTTQRIRRSNRRAE